MKNDEYAHLVGISITDAQTTLKALGKVMRITKQDGEHYMITMNIRFDRVNVHVENGLISSVEGVG
jgi:chitinase